MGAADDQPADHGRPEPRLSTAAQKSPASGASQTLETPAWRRARPPEPLVRGDDPPERPNAIARCRGTRVHEEINGYEIAASLALWKALDTRLSRALEEDSVRGAGGVEA